MVSGAPWDPWLRCWRSRLCGASYGCDRVCEGRVGVIRNPPVGRGVAGPAGGRPPGVVGAFPPFGGIGVGVAGYNREGRTGTPTGLEGMTWRCPNRHWEDW